MSNGDEPTRLKSAYELALERLESQGIERPDQGSLTDATRARVAEARSKAEAKLAELEILHGKTMATLIDPAERARVEDEYATERRRIERRRDEEIERLRRGGSEAGTTPQT